MVVIVMGVSGSGKSTIGARLAKALDSPFIEGDNYHPEANRRKMAAGIPLDDADRAPWLEALAQVLAEAEQQAGCVLACSSLKQVYRDTLGSRLSAKPTFVYLHAAPELLAERLSERQGHFFPVRLLDSQLETLERPTDAIELDLNKGVEELVDEAIKQIEARG